MRRTLSLIALHAGLAVIAAAQTLTPTPTPAPSGPPPTHSVALDRVVAPTRADLAGAYMRLEREIEAKGGPLKGAGTRTNNRFDQATAAIFGGAVGAAIGQLDYETASLRRGHETLPQHVISMSMQVRIDPPVWRPGMAPPRLTASPLYDVEFDGSRYAAPRVVLALTDGSGTVRAEHEVEFSKDAAWPWSAALFSEDIPADLRPGVYTVMARWAEGAPTPFEVGRWQIVPRSMDAAREANEARLSAAERAEPGLTRAIGMIRSRNALLSDSPSPDILPQWLADQSALADEVDAEIVSIEQGVDPFIGRTGGWWCRLPSSGVEIPLRVYIPANLPEGPAPLVVALHGMGGDENMFMDGYGAGVIRRLADEHGFIVVSPEGSGMAYVASFDALVDAVSDWRAVDRSRVHLIGHSMGAGLAMTIARQRPNAVASMALIAGGGSFPAPGAPMPRCLVVGAELDMMVRAAALEQAALGARERGLPVEHRTIADQGHTLVVGAALPDVVDWLMPAR